MAKMPGALANAAVRQPARRGIPESRAPMLSAPPRPPRKSVLRPPARALYKERRLRLARTLIPALALAASLAIPAAADTVAFTFDNVANQTLTPFTAPATTGTASLTVTAEPATEGSWAQIVLAADLGPVSNTSGQVLTNITSAFIENVVLAFSAPVDSVSLVFGSPLNQVNCTLEGLDPAGQVVWTSTTPSTGLTTPGVGETASITAPPGVLFSAIRVKVRTGDTVPGYVIDNVQANTVDPVTIINNMFTVMDGTSPVDGPTNYLNDTFQAQIEAKLDSALAELAQGNAAGAKAALIDLKWVIKQVEQQVPRKISQDVADTLTSLCNSAVETINLLYP